MSSWNSTRSSDLGRQANTITQRSTKSMTNFINYSHYSVLDSILKPSEIVDISVQQEFESASITDLNSMAGIVQFYKSAKKQGIKPILGLSSTFMDGGALVMLAKNHQGYKSLLEILALSHSASNFFRHAQISMEILSDIDTSNLIFITGHEGSSIDTLISASDDYDDALSQVDMHISLLKSAVNAPIYINIDGHAHDYKKNLLIKLANDHSLELTYNNLTRYNNNKTSSYLYDVIQCKKLKTKLRFLEAKPNIYGPLQTNNLYHTHKDISDSIEEYNILSEPKLPKFDCPDGQSSIEFLKVLCRDAFYEKVDPKYKNKYIERAKYELGVFEETGLADYFLVLWDVIRYAEQDQGQLLGPARGSSAGCLISYLLDITKIDPIKYDLIFSRFYNEGRKGSMPDIDVDLPKRGREDVINYTVNKYGEDRVAQIATYQTFMGRAALKEILRAEDNMTYGEMNDITNSIEDKAKIADELQQMKEEGREPSVILWALENKSKNLLEWVSLEEDGSLTGDLANQFEMAIALEGVKSAQSKHAAGIVISQDPLYQSAPVLYDTTTKKQIVGLEYEDAEAMGLIKYDFLGLSTLDRLEDINKV